MKEGICRLVKCSVRQNSDRSEENAGNGKAEKGKWPGQQSVVNPRAVIDSGKHHTHFRRKWGINCKPGIKRKAGKVIRLKIPVTTTNDKTRQERDAECFYVDITY